MEYYVYKLIDPRDNSTFYVGKGCKRRMYRHVDEVQRGHKPNGSNTKLANKIKKILSSGLSIKYKKIFITDDENLAYDKEKELISKIGLENLCNLTPGGDGLTKEQSKNGRLKANKILHEKMKNNEEYYKYFCQQVSDGMRKYYANGGKNSFFGKHHSDETKAQIGKKNSKHQQGSGNSQYGTCWITKDGINKKIKNAELSLYLEQNWSKGRTVK